MFEDRLQIRVPSFLSTQVTKYWNELRSQTHNRGGAFSFLNQVPVKFPRDICPWNYPVKLPREITPWNYPVKLPREITPLNYPVKLPREITPWNYPMKLLREITPWNYPVNLPVISTGRRHAQVLSTDTSSEMFWEPPGTETKPSVSTEAR